jgi:hypothetical protein
MVHPFREFHVLWNKIQESIHKSIQFFSPPENGVSMGELDFGIPHPEPESKHLFWKKLGSYNKWISCSYLGCFTLEIVSKNTWTINGFHSVSLSPTMRDIYFLRNRV